MASIRYSQEDPSARDKVFQSKDRPHCGKQAHQLIVTPRLLVESGSDSEAWAFVDEPDWFVPSGASVVAADWRTESEGDQMWDPYIPGVQWQATLCAACKRMSLWREAQMIFPRTTRAAVAAHPDMPETAAVLFNEAAAVLDGSRRAAAALGRAALEALLKAVDESGAKRDLNKRIGELSGRINPALWKVLTALRVVGNDALHSEDGDLVALYLHQEQGELAETFLQAINELVEELVTRPKRSEEIYAMLPASKRDAAERAGAN
ncbi:DUF4145 domain-containing protein [Microbacterium sp. Mcb102]|uniref:DUF4145 domain-containing protein n=1 Tax=Microbacterium sp. Mcb102 TaxID=2926012 RepID=UPI0021C58EF1|nr:DUF4145 domain-containing protein [Microbacterium sp. Mcb102]